MKRLSIAEFNSNINKSGLHLSANIDTFSIPLTFDLYDIIYTNLYNELRTQL
jgi:hypothetical protein